MRLVAYLDWTSGRLTFARLDASNRVYGGRTKWSADTKQFLYTFTPATVDPKTNGLEYASGALIAAAATIGPDGTQLGVRSGVADAKELLLSARVIVTVALLGFAGFRPEAHCSPMPASTL